MARKPIFEPFFLFLGDFFPIFRVRPKSIFRRFFSDFGPEARNRHSPRHAYSQLWGALKHSFENASLHQGFQTSGLSIVSPLTRREATSGKERHTRRGRIRGHVAMGTGDIIAHSFRFSFWGTSAKTTLLENHPFVNPRKDYLGGRFGYFLFFLLREGKIGSGGGFVFLLKSQQEGGGAGGAEGPGGCLRRIGEFGGGGVNIFFRGRNVHQATVAAKFERGKKTPPGPPKFQPY